MIDPTIKNFLSYDPSTGLFTWIKPRKGILQNKTAGYQHHKGYTYIRYNGRDYAAHRLAWFYMTNDCEFGLIDHINRVKSDNRFCNLRIAENGQNRANSKTTNKHGLKGVRLLKWAKEGGKQWMSHITYNKKDIYLGCYYTKEEAHEAYAKKAKELHKDFSHF